jgi:hypothetical protein
MKLKFMDIVILTMVLYQNPSVHPEYHAVRSDVLGTGEEIKGLANVMVPGTLCKYSSYKDII